MSIALAEWIPEADWPPSLAGHRANQLVLDSRQVEPGAVFLAVPGRRSHGLVHAEEALPAERAWSWPIRGDMEERFRRPVS